MKTKPKRPNSPSAMSSVEARKNAIIWWQFAMGMLSELSQTATSLRDECGDPQSPLDGTVDCHSLTEFIEHVDEAYSTLLNCHPRPPITVNVPDPVQGGYVDPS